MYKKNYIIAFVLFAYCSISMGQTSCEEIEREYRFYENQSKTNKDADSLLLEFIKNLESQTPNECEETAVANGYITLMQSYRNSGDFQSLIDLSKEINSDPAKFLPNAEIQNQYIYEKADVLFILNNYQKSLEQLKDVDLERFKSDKLLTQINVLKGKNYLKMYEQDNNSYYLDSANYFFNKSLSYLKGVELKDREPFQLDFYLNKMAVQQAKKNYEALEKTADNALFLFEDLNDNHAEKVQFKYYQAISRFEQENSPSRKRYLDSLRPFFKYLPKNQQVDIYNKYFQLFDNQQQSDSAFHYYKLASAAKNEYNLENSNFKDQIHSIDISALESANKNIRSRNTSQTFILVILAVLSLGVISYLLMVSRRKRKKLEKQYNETYRKLEVFYSNRKAEKEVEKQRLAQSGKRAEKESKSQLQEELIDDIEQGLQKTEDKKLFLNPNFNLNYLAKKLNTNTTYLSIYFNHVKKQSFPNYVNHLRINYILEQLNEDPKYLNYSIEGLAKDCGYKDAGIFSKTFKNIVDIPPSYYINTLRKEKQKST